MGAPKKRDLTLLLQFVFFLSGICTVLIGQVLPILSSTFKLNDLQAGMLFPAQFSGSILGTIISNWFGRRHRFLLATVIGSMAMAIGLAAMNLTSFEGCLIGFFVNGLGIGLTLPSVNLLVLEMNPTKGASALSLLNFCWGAGAILCKPFVDATAFNGSISFTTLAIAFPLVVAGALLLLLPREAEASTRIISSIENGPSAVPIWTTAIAWTIATFNLIQVGYESGMGGWLTTYADRLNGQPVVDLFSPTFLYFLFFVAGRGVAPFYFRFMTENQVLFLDIGMMLAGMLMILAAGDMIWLGIGAAVSGFGASSVFPTNLSRFSRTFGSAATRKATPLFVTGTLGAAVVTWMIGFVSDQADSLYAGMLTQLVCVLGVAAIQIFLVFGEWHTRKHQGG